MSAFDDWMESVQPPLGKGAVSKAAIEEWMRNAWNSRGEYDIRAVMETCDPASMEKVLAAIRRLNA